MIEELRPEGTPYYPDSVAISHTASAVTSVVAEDDGSFSQYQTVTGNGRWELGLQVAFLDPVPVLELEERSSSREGVQLELPCPVVAVNGECEKGHFWAKECVCNREWCMELEGRCGGDGGAAHQRRKARWLPKARKIGDMGRFVLTVPPEIRGKYRTQRALGDLGTAAKRMMQRHGYKRGLRRWHFFGEDHPGHGLQGDGLPPYHPHLEVLVDGGRISRKKLGAIKRSWANILKVPAYRINVYYQYIQWDDDKKKWHRLGYALRPTFTDWRWDEPLAYELIGFHNAQTWGSRADWEGPDLWGHPDSAMDKKLKEQELLEQGFCPFDETFITWGGLMSPKLLVEPWESVGAGYWRYTLDSMFSQEILAIRADKKRVRGLN